MDASKIGELIYQLRKEQQLTQAQLAEKLAISDKTISKWERGLGCPDISLLGELAKILGIDVQKLLSGELEVNDLWGGNMKKMIFYVCPHCQNVVMTMTDTDISCCGKKLNVLKPQRADETEKLTVEIIEDDFFVTSNHPMTKTHYLAFVALLTGDGLILCKQYPEWELQTRIPISTTGRLLWYCTQHGLFYQDISAKQFK